MATTIRTRRRKTLPLALRADFDQFEIGTRVSCTHRAAVARYKKLWKDYEPAPLGIGDYTKLDLTGAKPEKAPFGWKIVEGCLKNDFADDGLTIFDMSYRHRMYYFAGYPQAKLQYGKANKTVMVWPEDYYGWVIGIVRKAIGESHAAYHSSGGYWEPPEWEPGYCSVDMYVDLYVIKLAYVGVQYVYAPMWAVSKVEDAA